MAGGQRSGRSEPALSLARPWWPDAHRVLLRSISRAIAFENALDRGENLVERLKGGFATDRDGAQLVHCATDGESYGHHKQFGDMALAAAIAQIEAEGFAVLTNYGAFLAEQPPAFEVQIRELTSRCAT